MFAGKLKKKKITFAETECTVRNRTLCVEDEDTACLQNGRFKVETALFVATPGNEVRVGVLSLGRVRGRPEDWRRISASVGPKASTFSRRKEALRPPRGARSSNTWADGSVDSFSSL